MVIGLFWAGCGGDPVERSCSDYCETLVGCSDAIDLEECTLDCVQAAGSCQADEQDQALTALDECAVSSCNRILGCSIGASLECYLGL